MKDEKLQETIDASRMVIKKNAKAARTQGKADLLAHLGKLINRAELSDLEFVCKDGVSVGACQIFLAGRSPVFDSMLTNGMLETNASVINLPEVPSPALLAIFEFLYTGNIVGYAPDDWQTGLEIISAAHFFLLPTVDRIVEEFLMTEIPDHGEDLQQAASMLSEAMTVKSLSHDRNAVLLHLVPLLESRWMHPDYACHLSEEAVDFILRQTKPESKAEDRLDGSFEEYFRFRGVILWCMYNAQGSSAEEVDEMVNEAIPTSKDRLYSKGVKDLGTMEVVWLPNYRGGRGFGNIQEFLESQEAFRESAIRLLAHIEWVRVPPTIFVRIIEPLKLVPEACLLDIFRFHSLHRLMPLNLTWAHNKAYSVRCGGLMILKHGTSTGSAICRLENRIGDDPCVWRLIVRKVDSSLCQVGFVCSEETNDPWESWNFEGDCVESLKGSRITTSRVIEWKSNLGAVYFDGHGSDFRSRESLNVKSAERIEFQYFRSRRSCAVTVGDRHVGIIWTGLPGTSVFPAVCLGDNTGASVSLEIVSGFELF